MICRIGKDKCITNFVLRNPKEEFNNANRRVSVNVDIIQGGVKVGSVDIPERGWSSPMVFKNSISSITDLSYVGSGSNELQLIKNNLFRKVQ